MSTIVPNQRQALENIRRFRGELLKSDELRRRLAFARAWYAIKDNNGDWIFAPSKFCGYDGMTAEEYFNDDPRDGRRTEKQLQKWFALIPEDEPLFEELYEKLTTFLSSHDKPPSSAIRISVLKEYYEERVVGDNANNHQPIAALIIAIARGLPAGERSKIKSAL